MGDASDPKQQASSARYRNVLADHGMARDMAGAAAAGQAAKSVAQDIASGDTDNIDKKIQAKSPQMTEAALKTCQDLAGIKAAQDSLAGQLTAFTPYAGIIEADQVRDCEAPTTQHG